MVRLTGAVSNPQVMTRVRQAVRALHRIRDHGTLPESVARVQMRPRTGTIEGAVFAALADAGVAMSGPELRLVAEQRLGIPVSASTVSSCLLVVCRREGSGIVRVGRGMYQAN